MASDPDLARDPAAETAAAPIRRDVGEEIVNGGEVPVVRRHEQRFMGTDRMSRDGRYASSDW